MPNPTLIDASVWPIQGDHDSLFICCSSYEERSTLGVRRLSAEYRADRSIICYAAEYADKGRAPEYFEELSRRLASHSRTGPDAVRFGIEDPLGFIRMLEETLGDVRGADPFEAVTLDTSTFPRQELLLLLRYLDSRPVRGQIRLLYGEPAKYATEEDSPEDRWLTRGVRSVHSVPGFGGVQFPDRRKLLMVILGHEGERTHICVRRHQPDKVVFIPQGEEQHHSGLREISERQNEAVTSTYGKEHIWGIGVPSRGVAETAKSIATIFQNHRYSHNMFVAANGTKLQLIGVYLTVRRFPEIQVTYAAPAVYNWKTYSTGTGPMWELHLEPR